MIQQERLLGTFIDLVKLDSPTFQENIVADYIKKKLSLPDVTIEEDDAGKKINGQCGNLLIRIPATSNGPTLMFSGHMDTVDPGQGIEPVINDGIITSRGKTILGADDKSGIAPIIELITVLIENNIPHPEIEAIFTVAEEKGLYGSKNFDKNWTKAKFGYVLDGEGKPGKIVIRSPYQNTIKAILHGKSAHAGVEPEKGINSIQAAAKAISKMELGRINDLTTANIGIIKGGRAINIVPEKTMVKGEIRSHTLSELEIYTDKIIKRFKFGAEDTGAKVDINVVKEFDGYHFTEKDGAVVLASQAIKQLGIEPKYAISGGGSDTNVFNQAGINAVTLSTGMKNAHSVDESLSVSYLISITEIILNIVSQALGSQDD